MQGLDAQLAQFTKDQETVFRHVKGHQSTFGYHHVKLEFGRSPCLWLMPMASYLAIYPGSPFRQRSMDGYGFGPNGSPD